MNHATFFRRKYICGVSSTTEYSLVGKKTLHSKLLCKPAVDPKKHYNHLNVCRFWVFVCSKRAEARSAPGGVRGRRGRRSLSMEGRTPVKRKKKRQKNWQRENRKEKALYNQKTCGPPFVWRCFRGRGDSHTTPWGVNEGQNSGSGVQRSGGMFPWGGTCSHGSERNRTLQRKKAGEDIRVPRLGNGDGLFRTRAGEGRDGTRLRGSRPHPPPPPPQPLAR